MMFRISPALEQQRQQRTGQIADTTGAMASTLRLCNVQYNTFAGHLSFMMKRRFSKPQFIFTENRTKVHNMLYNDIETVNYIKSACVIWAVLTIGQYRYNNFSMYLHN